MACRASVHGLPAGRIHIGRLQVSCLAVRRSRTEKQFAKIGFCQQRRGFRTDRDAAGHHDIAPVADLHRVPRALLDQQHRGARLRERHDVLVQDHLRHRGREVRRRHIQDQDLWLEYEAAADREQLALTAAECLGLPLEHGPKNRQPVEYLVDPPGDSTPRQQIGAHLQVVLEGERREDVTGLGHIPSPKRASSFPVAPVTSAPPSCTRPEKGLRRPVRAFSRVDLPAPFGPITQTIVPRNTVSDTSWTMGAAP